MEETSCDRPANCIFASFFVVPIRVRINHSSKSSKTQAYNNKLLYKRRRLLEDKHILLQHYRHVYHKIIFRSGVFRPPPLPVRRLDFRSNRTTLRSFNMAVSEATDFLDIYNLELQLRERINELHWKTVRTKRILSCMCRAVRSILRAVIAGRSSEGAHRNSPVSVRDGDSAGERKTVLE